MTYTAKVHYGTMPIVEPTYTLTTRQSGWFRWHGVLATEFGEWTIGPYRSRQRAYDEIYRLAASWRIYVNR